jgi:hypothetical protein
MRPSGLSLIVLAFAGFCLEAAAVDAARVHDSSSSPQTAFTAGDAEAIEPAAIDAGDDNSSERSSGRKTVTAGEPVPAVRADSAACRARHQQDDVRRAMIGPPLIYCLCALLI